MFPDDIDDLNLGRDVTTLAVSAAGRMDYAMKAWADGDFAQVGLMAPMAVEHLGKAVLWNKNPTLVLRLDPNDEQSLFVLATAPSLATTGLKTIGLQHVLIRVEKVLAAGPVLVKADRERMVNVRNGFTHVGEGELSRHVLLDSLKALKPMLENLGIGEDLFYGAHANHVVGLLDRKKSEIGHRVLEKIAAAGQRVARLQETLNEHDYMMTITRLEESRLELDGPAYRLRAELLAVDHYCKVCKCDARLFGFIELEEHVEFDAEPLGSGKYAQVAVPYWRIWFTPQGYECAVCHLLLAGTEELTEADIDTARRDVAPEELGDSFDLDEVVRNVFGPDYV